MATSISDTTQFLPSAVFNPSTNPGAVPFLENGYASTGFLIWGAALVFLMTPGLAFFYSGMSRVKNALSLIMICYLAIAVVTIQWTLFGFSLTFSETGSAFLGNFAYGGLTGIGSSALAIAPSVPGIVLALYQMQFAVITPALIFGSVAERIRLIPAMVFIFCWATVVYNPAAYWTWSLRGWLRNISCISTTALDQTPCGIGSFDYAGGGPVHVASGFAGLAYCLFLGRRRNPSGREEWKAHNLTHVFLGTALLWFGWFAFNGGSAISATPRAGMAAIVTTISASAASLSWVLFDYFFHNRGKVSGLAFCSGAVAGLVVITPAAGFVAPWAAIVMGLIGGVFCNLSCRIKNVFGFDDSLDAWGVHGMGGVLGNLLTGIFAQKWIASLDGGVIEGGWLEGNWKQLGYQAAGTAVIAVWSFVISYLLLLIINLIPGLHIRPSEDEELLGTDIQMGEVAYELMATKTSHNLAVMADRIHKGAAANVDDSVLIEGSTMNGSTRHH